MRSTPSGPDEGLDRFPPGSRATRRPPVELLRHHGPVLWSWAVGVVLAFAVQVGEGLGRPSEGLALSAAALPALVVALVPARSRRKVAAGTVVALGVLALVNALYHRAFDTYMPVWALGQMDQGWEVRDYVAGLLRPRDLASVLVVIVALIALLRRPAPGGGAGGSRLPGVICLAAVLPALGWAWWWAPTGRDHDTGGYLYSHLVDVRILGAGWRRGAAPSPEERARVERWREANPPPRPSADPWFGRAAGANLLLVQVEALGDWLLEAEVGGEPVMPVLRSLASRGLRFTRVYDQTHLGRSSDADHLVMTSRHPLERTAVSMARPDLDPVGLADLLSARGYATLAAHAHHRAFWNAGPRRIRYGFETTLFDRELGEGPTLGFGLTDGALVDRVAPRLGALAPPWMAWIVTLTMHGPYPPIPSSSSSLAPDTLEGTALGGYYQRARHTDDALGALLEHLEVSGALDRTVVVVFGDHPQEDFLPGGVMDEVGRVSTAAPPEARALLRDRVPVVIGLPGWTAGQAVPRVGGLLDLGPTLLHLLGIPVPPSFVGRPLTLPGPGLAARASGEVVAPDRLWTGSGCYRIPSGSLLEPGACDRIRAEAREELEVSWLLTERDWDR